MGRGGEERRGECVVSTCTFPCFTFSFFFIVSQSLSFRFVYCSNSIFLYHLSNNIFDNSFLLFFNHVSAFAKTIILFLLLSLHFHFLHFPIYFCPKNENSNYKTNNDTINIKIYERSNNLLYFSFFQAIIRLFLSHYHCLI